MRKKLTVGATIAIIALISFQTKASASIVNVGARAIRFTVKRTSSLVATYAAAHNIAGSGAGAPFHPGLCVNGDITGSGVGCSSNDFFPHSSPPGNDSALASAFDHSRLFGFDVTADTNTFTQKGDLAIAGAYAKGGTKIDTQGSVKFSVGLTLGSLTLNASLDPGIVNYDLSVSDLDIDAVNQEVANSFISTQLQDQGLTVSKPETTFYQLHIDFNAETNEFDVVNTSDFIVGSLLTESDFEIGNFFDNGVLRPGLRLKDESLGNITLELPGDSTDTQVSVDAQLFEVAITTPEPSSTIGFLVLGTLGAASTLKSKLKSSKLSEKETTKVS